MNLTRAAVATSLCFVIGCSSGSFDAKPLEADQFASEVEELEYLNALSNPSVQQFKRRKELQTKADGVAAAAAEKSNLERREREKVTREAEAKKLLAEAEEYHKEHPIADLSVANRYRKLLSEYSDTVASETALVRFNEVRKEIELREKTQEK